MSKKSLKNKTMFHLKLFQVILDTCNWTQQLSDLKKKQTKIRIFTFSWKIEMFYNLFACVFNNVLKEHCF